MTSRRLLFVSGFGALALLAACSDPVSPAGQARGAVHASLSANALEHSQKCDAAPPAADGALNMLNDPTMGSTPMTHDAPQGNTGMYKAVGASGC